MERNGICKNIAACSLAKGKVLQPMVVSGMTRCTECGKFLKGIDQKKLDNLGKKLGKYKAAVFIASVVIIVLALLGGGVYAYLQYGNPPVFSIAMIQKNALILEGETKELNIKITPHTADKAMIWTSSDESVARVDDTGVITSIKPGKTTITAVAASNKNKKALCEITVEENPEKTESDTPVGSVTFDRNSLLLKKGEWTEVTTCIEPAEATSKYLNWRSGDESIAIVSNKTIIALKEGRTIVIVTSADGTNLTDTCHIEVTKGTASDNKIALELPYGIYIGSMKNGKPEGKGKMIYKKRILISEDDRQQRYAEAWQSVDGIWYEGRLDIGELIDRNGSKIASLNIGRRP